ncbi:MAG: hypothetical protein ABJP79_00735 [Tateyamaria sp.]|uniref:hypothetical protein n=1 Tax=Tateyamaria sp. TaxID=1929288 RepID=UPI00329C144C
MYKQKYLTMKQIAAAIGAPEHAARIVVARCFNDLPTAHVMPSGATRAHKGYEVFAVVAEAQRTLKYYSDDMATKMMAMAIPARGVAV